MPREEPPPSKTWFEAEAEEPGCSAQFDAQIMPTIHPDVQHTIRIYGINNGMITVGWGTGKATWAIWSRIRQIWRVLETSTR